MFFDVRKKKIVVSVVYSLLFVFVLSVLLWKCRFGYSSWDEAFYLTIPYRFCKGDVPLLHEWHLTQLGGLILYPLMKIRLWLNPGMDGIILSFRYLFTMIWALCALFLFLRLKCFSLTGSAVASLTFLIYTHFGIMALSYYTCGIMFLLVSCVMLATARKLVRLQYVIAGVLFAGAVLCCPYLVLLYILFTVCFLISIRKRSAYMRKVWIWTSAGCAILFGLFCLFLFSRGVTPGKIMETASLMLMDPEHPRQSFKRVVFKYFSAIVGSCAAAPFCMAAAGMVLWLSVKKKISFYTGLIVTCIACMVWELWFLFFDPYICFFLFPLNLIVPYCVLHCDSSKVRIPFFYIWLPGLIYTFCMHMASNQNFYAISSVSTVMCVAGTVILVATVSEKAEDTRMKQTPSGQPDKKRRPRAVYLAVFVLLMIQLCTLGWFRYNFIYWEKGGISEQTEVCDSGPCRGIRMIPGRLQLYRDMETDMRVIREDQKIQKVLILTRDITKYLLAEKEIASYSTWLSNVNDQSIHRLEQYFALFPEKKPDVIFVNDSFKRYVGYFQRYGYRAKKMKTGVYLYKKQQS